MEQKKAIVHRRWKQGRAMIILGLISGLAAATVNYVSQPGVVFLDTFLSVLGMASVAAFVVWLSSKVRDEVIRRLEKG